MVFCLNATTPQLHFVQQLPLHRGALDGANPLYNMKKEKIMILEMINLYGMEVLGALLLCLFGFFGMIAKRILDTPLKVQLAKIAVQFAEQTCKTLCGEEKLNAAIARLPMQRLGDPDEIATVAAFLCTDDSSWVTGQTIMVSGGAACT